MAHELGNTDTMFSVRETPWHKLGRVVQNAPTTEDAIKLAGLDWAVDKVPMFLADGVKVDPKIAQAVRRATDGRILGVVGPRYTPWQNAEAFKWFDPFLSAGEATLETAGSLRDGKRVWVLAKIGHNGDSHAEVVPGDDVINHMLIANGHDGSLAIHVGRVRTRVVCANTLRGALGEGSTLRVRHTKSATETLEEVRDLMRAEHDAFSKDISAFRELAKKQVTKAGIREYVEAVFPDSFKKKEDMKRGTSSKGAQGRVWAPSAGASLVNDLLGGASTAASAGVDYSEQIAEVGSEILDRIGALVETGRGADIPGVRGTMWGLYNATAEYLQYEAGRGPTGANEKRMDSMVFGGAATKNALALQKAMEFGQYGRGGR